MAEVELPDPGELEEKRLDSFSKKVALCTAVYAVILAICALGGNNAMKEMLLAQQEASNQWAYFQAKNIRAYLYRMEKDRLETQILERGGAMKPAVIKHFKERLRTVADEEARLAKDKEEISTEAKKQEQERDVNRAKDPYFDFAEVLLQISIVLSSISIIAHSQPIFLLSTVSAALGSLLTLNGFLLLVRLPFFH